MSEIDQAYITLNCLEFAVSLLVLPVSLTTLIVLGTRCYRQKRLLEALPLIATQFLSALIWGCAAALQLGNLDLAINGTRLLKRDWD